MKGTGRDSVAGSSVKRLFSATMIRWLAAGGMSFFTATGTTVALHEGGGVSERFAFLAALVVVFVLNFLTMRYFVYGRPLMPIMPQFARYGVSAVLIRGLEFVAYAVSVDWLGIHYVVAMAVILPTSMLFKFFYYGGVVFGWGRDDHVSVRT